MAHLKWTRKGAAEQRTRVSRSDLEFRTSMVGHLAFNILVKLRAKCIDTRLVACDFDPTDAIERIGLFDHLDPTVARLYARLLPSLKCIPKGARVDSRHDEIARVTPKAETGEVGDRTDAFGDRSAQSSDKHVDGYDDAKYRECWHG